LFGLTATVGDGANSNSKIELADHSILSLEGNSDLCDGSNGATALVSLKGNSIWDNNGESILAGSPTNGGKVVVYDKDRSSIHAQSITLASNTVLVGEANLYAKNTDGTNGIVNDSGAIRPGDSATAADDGSTTINPAVGVATINGTFQASPTTALTIDINGTGSGNYDQLVVNGAATLDGKLAVNLNGYTPKAGDSFVVVQTSGKISGKFQTIPDSSNLTAGQNLFWNVKYENNEVILTVERIIDDLYRSIEGASASGAVATILGLTTDDIADLNATVRWGDGTTSTTPDVQFVEHDANDVDPRARRLRNPYLLRIR
jgi:hypothetical protein